MPIFLMSSGTREIASALNGFTVVITKSTVPVGTGDEVERIISETRPDLDFAVVSNPEFLREGSAIYDFKHPDRIIVGTEMSRAGGRGRDLPPALPKAGSNPLYGPPDGRVDQVCRECIPGNEDYLHQRDRRSMRTESARMFRRSRAVSGSTTNGKNS